MYLREWRLFAFKVNWQTNTHKAINLNIYNCTHVCVLCIYTCFWVRSLNGPSRAFSDAFLLLPWYARMCVRVCVLKKTLSLFRSVHTSFSLLSSAPLFFIIQLNLYNCCHSIHAEDAYLHIKRKKDIKWALLLLSNVMLI